MDKVSIVKCLKAQPYCQKLSNKYRLYGLRVLLFGYSSGFAIYLLLFIFTASLIIFLGIGYLQNQTAALDKNKRNYLLVRSAFAEESYGEGGNSVSYFNEKPAGLMEHVTQVIEVESDKKLAVVEPAEAKYTDEPSLRLDELRTNSQQGLATSGEGFAPLRHSSRESHHLLITQQQNHAIQLGYKALYDGELKTANLSFIQALDVAPNNRHALNGLAATQRQLGMDEAALVSYQKVLAIDPTNLHAFESVLVMLGSQIEGVEWKKEIKKMSVIYPESAVLNAVLGHVSSTELDWKTAQRYYFSAHRLNSQSADYALNLAISLDHLGEYALAQKYYTMALSQSKSDDLNVETSPVKRRLSALKQFVKQAGEQ